MDKIDEVVQLFEKNVLVDWVDVGSDDYDPGTAYNGLVDKIHSGFKKLIGYFAPGEDKPKVPASAEAEGAKPKPKEAESKTAGNVVDKAKQLAQKVINHPSTPAVAAGLAAGAGAGLGAGYLANKKKKQ